MEKETKFSFPTEVVELPSRGLLYPESSPLASGTVEMKYMTAKEEDILTNQNYLQKGIVIDKLLQSMIVSKVNYDDLLIGDKNAILIAARILGYGKDYTFTYDDEVHTVDLSLLQNKEMDEKVFDNKKNEFEFKLPTTGVTITFKLLTHGDEQAIEDEVKGLKKIDKNNSSEGSTRLKYMILSVEGDTSRKVVREFVDNALLARDARSLREYIRNIQPDVDTKIFPEGGPDEGIEIPFGLSFFWPDLRV
jgi:hypothetical protein